MSRQRGWALDLALGIRLAFRGARTRTALTAIGIGLSVGVLLFASALPNAIVAHQDRTEARRAFDSQPLDPADGPKSPAPTVLVAYLQSAWKGAEIYGTLLQADGPAPPLPPGLANLPAAGEIVVSPQLAQLLREPGTELLAARLPGRVVGTLGPDALSGPAERLWYGGSATLTDRSTTGGSVMRVSEFGEDGSTRSEDAFAKLLILVGSIVLLFPIAILVSTASRFGSARRDRRLAALRLLGTSRQETARIAAGESLAAALLGVAVGGALFLAARLVVEQVEVFGFSVFAADVQPDPVLAAAVVAAVLVVTIATTLLSMRRVSVEPLSVVRRGRGAKRRVWWRPLPTLAGFAVLTPLMGSTASELDDAQNQIAVGAVLVLVGIVALLPWLVAASVSRLRGWSVASQLAIRNLQTEAAVAARIVSGIAVAVAGAIALQMLLTVPASGLAANQTAGVERSTATAGIYAQGTPADQRRLEQTLASTAGVTRAHVTSRQELRGHGHGDGQLPTLIVGDCAALRDLAEIGACDDDTGTIVRVASPVPDASQPAGGVGASASAIVIPVAGERVKTHSWWEAKWTKFTLPADLQTVSSRSDLNGGFNFGILATPNAVPPPAGGSSDIQASIWLDPTDPLALERARTAIARIWPLSGVYEAGTQSEADEVATARRMLMAGAALLLLLVGASLVVTTLEQLGERRRSLATLAAFGTPRSVLRRTLWWQTAIPVTIGLALAVAIGTGLGAILLALQGAPIELDVAGTLSLLLIGAGMVIAVTVVALPLLRRVAAPQAMRAE